MCTAVVDEGRGRCATVVGDGKGKWVYVCRSKGQVGLCVLQWFRGRGKWVYVCRSGSRVWAHMGYGAGRG